MGKVILLLVVFLLIGIVAGASLGSTSISFLQVIKVFLHSWGLGSHWSFPNGEEVIVFLIRLPRVLIAVLVGAALGGSVFLVFCDLIARTTFPLGEIRVGIVTAIVGAPYFLYLLSKAKKEGETI